MENTHAHTDSRKGKKLIEKLSLSILFSLTIEIRGEERLEEENENRMRRESSEQEQFC